MNLKETTFSKNPFYFLSAQQWLVQDYLPPPIAADGGEPVAVDPWMQEGQMWKWRTEDRVECGLEKPLIPLTEDIWRCDPWPHVEVEDGRQGGARP